MKYTVRIESQEKHIDIEETGGVFKISIDGETRTVDCQSAGHRDYLSLIIDNKSYLVESAPVKADEGLYYAIVNGSRYEIDVLDARLLAARDAANVIEDHTSHVVNSPMPGLIVDVRVNVGDKIKAGTALVIMEAMKMQNELVSEIDGIVKAINIKPKDAVESQTPLIEIERAE